MKPSYSSKLRNPFLRPVVLTAAVLALGSAAAQAVTHTWDGTVNAEWFAAGKWSPDWVNDYSGNALVNSGYVYAFSSVNASSLTIGDGIGDSAEAKNASNNAFAGIISITINSDGLLSSSSNTTSHMGAITLNGGTIDGNDNGGSAALFGIFNFDNTVTVNGGANTSTISTTGGGIALSQTGGTVFDVADGAAAVDLLVSGTFLHKPPHITSTGLIKNGAGTMNLTNTNTYLGGTTVNAGTLGLAGGGSAGVIRGTLNINNAGTTVQLNSNDAIGIANDATRISTVNIVDGEITNTGAFNNGYRTNFNLTGGTMSSAAGGRFDFTTGFGITTLASANSSTISAWILMRDGNNMPISVADGAAATDLLISGPI